MLSTILHHEFQISHQYFRVDRELYCDGNDGGGARERLRFREMRVIIDSCSSDPDGDTEGGTKFERVGKDGE